MKTNTLTLGVLCVLALCAMPLAGASITVSACTDHAEHQCTSRTISGGDATCYERATPLNGSVVDTPTCTLNF